jgi:hypothetical protein
MRGPAMMDFRTTFKGSATTIGRLLLLLSLVVPLGFSARAAQRSVTLSWESGGDATAIGTYLYWGVVTNGTTQLTARVDAGASLIHTINGLEENRTYFFYVTAYNSSRIESVPSNTVRFRPVITHEQMPVSMDLRLLTTSSGSTAFTLSSQDPPQPGSLNGGRPVESYQPPAGFIGNVGMTYQFSEGLPEPVIALVSVIVETNQPPRAHSASFEVAAGNTLRVSLPGTDPEGQPVSYSLQEFPRHGSIVNYTASGVDYRAPLDFSGEDFFTYTVSDGVQDSAPGTITITIQNPTVIPNQPPVISLYSSSFDLTLPARAIISGAVTDVDGPSPVTVQWSKVSGPGTVGFEPATTISTAATFSQAGTYVLQVTAFDGLDTTTRQVQAVLRPPLGPLAVSRFIEAESAIAGDLVAPMSVRTETTASGETVVHVSSNSRNRGSVRNTFTIPEAGDYVIWCRVKAVGDGSNSFFVRVNNGTEEVFEIGSAHYSQEYRWVPLQIQGGVATAFDQSPAFNARVYTLAQGTHSITFRGRATDTRLDCFMVVNQSVVNPSLATTSYSPELLAEAQAASKSSPQSTTPTLTLEWNAIQGLRYEVVGRDTLNSPWQVVAELLPAQLTGPHELALPAPAGPGSRFFRVRLLE